MIKLKIVGEEKPAPPPTRTIVFDLRRHKQAGTTPACEQLAYLVGRDLGFDPFATDICPVKIDGDRMLVEVRRRDFAKLGFTLVVKD